MTTGENVTVAFVDQGYTGARASADPADDGIELAVVKLPMAEKGFVLQPRRSVVERSFAWASGFGRLARDYERLPDTVRGLHFLVFVCLARNRLAVLLDQSASPALVPRYL